MIYFGFQYQTYISYIDDTHQILFGPLTPSNVIVSISKVHVRTGGRADRRTEMFFCLCCLLRHRKHEHS